MRLRTDCRRDAREMFDLHAYTASSMFDLCPVHGPATAGITPYKRRTDNELDAMGRVSA